MEADRAQTPFAPVKQKAMGTQFMLHPRYEGWTGCNASVSAGVAQIFNLLYRRLAVGRFAGWKAGATGEAQSQYSTSFLMPGCGQGY